MAVQVIREFLPSGACLRLNIDATKRGNVSRFFNHRCGHVWSRVLVHAAHMWPGAEVPRSACLQPELLIHRPRDAVERCFLCCRRSCDGGNLRMDIVRSRGDLMPRVAFFAARDIGSGDELTFAYGHSAAGPSPADGASAATSAPPQRCFCNTASCLGFLPRDGR